MLCCTTMVPPVTGVCVGGLMHDCSNSSSLAMELLQFAISVCNDAKSERPRIVSMEMEVTQVNLSAILKMKINNKLNKHKYLDGYIYIYIVIPIHIYIIQKYPPCYCTYRTLQNLQNIQQTGSWFKDISGFSLLALWHICNGVLVCYWFRRWFLTDLAQSHHDPQNDIKENLEIQSWKIVLKLSPSELMPPWSEV